jgi:hypothetical protein
MQPDSTSPEPAGLYLGLQLYELLTLVGIVAGPIAAVAISLIFEHFRRQREAKRIILQTLLVTRGRYADPAYTWAIRATALEFARSVPVMAAYEQYLHSVRLKPLPEQAEQHHREAGRREGLLISEMLKDLGYRGLSAEQIEAYTAEGLAAREELIERALKAVAVLPLVADRSAKAAEEMLKRMPPPAEE